MRSNVVQGPRLRRSTPANPPTPAVRFNHSRRADVHVGAVRMSGHAALCFFSLVFWNVVTTTAPLQCSKFGGCYKVDQGYGETWALSWVFLPQSVVGRPD